MRSVLYFFAIVTTAAFVCGGPFSEYPVTSGIRCLGPDLDEFGDIVWQQWYAAGKDWDVYWMDLNAADPAVLVADWTGHQTAPAVWGTLVAFEDEYSADDHDIYVKDLDTDLDPNTVAASGMDERHPAIHGNTVAWHRLYVDDSTGDSDWDVAMADVTDITEIAEVPVYLVTPFEADQQSPGVYRNTVVWQDNYYGDFDISSADAWLKNDPLEKAVSFSTLPQEHAAIWKNYVVWHEDFGGGNFDIMAADITDPDHPRVFNITTNTASQMNPDIYEHIVVWQDNRAGNWDIYGCNLITGTEFRITSNTTAQTVPTIGGGYVAWVDMRTGTESIYAAVLAGTTAGAACSNAPAGDYDGDCKVGLSDLLELSSSWLACGLEPVSVCN